MEELIGLYEKIKTDIKDRIKQFDNVRLYADNMQFLKELVFCLMTPQSKARTCAYVTDMIFENGEVFKVSEKELSDMIRTVRFRNHKAKYIKEALKKFEHSDLRKKISSFKKDKEARQWFANNVKGYGYKEASHFLRNVGFGYELAILDRHILKNLVRYKVIDAIPSSLTPKMYKQIEEKMYGFSNDISIPMHHLDFLLWYKETKEVFK